jgi:hypothetical protein
MVQQWALTQWQLQCRRCCMRCCSCLHKVRVFKSWLKACAQCLNVFVCMFSRQCLLCALLQPLQISKIHAQAVPCCCGRHAQRYTLQHCMQTNCCRIIPGCP